MRRDREMTEEISEFKKNTRFQIERAHLEPTTEKNNKNKRSIPKMSLEISVCQR